MKRIKNNGKRLLNLFVSIIIFAMMLTANSFAYSAPPIGNEDNINGMGLYGWAWQPEAPNVSVTMQVKIYDMQNQLLTIYNFTADQLRNDLLQAI